MGSCSDEIMWGGHLATTASRPSPRPSLKRIMEKMNVFGPAGLDVASLPFAAKDTTSGNETELQVVVAGKKDCVDLPVRIEESNYYANILRRAAAGELTRKSVTDLEAFIASNQNDIWENSWVRFPMMQLGRRARRVLERDLLVDKSDAAQGYRSDLDQFMFRKDGQEFIRIPVSYLLKLSLADVVDSPCVPRLLTDDADRLMDHFLSDNTSPETYSFHLSPICREGGMGISLAKETAKRFLLTQLLVLYANERFGLRASGQRAMVFFSPHPPIRQKKLNACISDAFYREIFMNPCLSGWRMGEAKQQYMHLCHQVLSRSQLNAVAKLREAGIITSNLVTLPNTSNISLANNGVHISLGSRRLSALMAQRESGWNGSDEKYAGDLTIKILEHFLPLFTCSYSAAPYRLDFSDFHPEQVLGFLPHELDFTHLRMLWRRWRKKARLKILGQPITPFGPAWIDKALSSIFRLRGDFIPDYRLVDYLVALMSTEKSPALDGTLQNHERLKHDLSDLGVFDRSMSLYSFVRLREFSAVGYSGFESRYYSLFPSFRGDMAKALEVQNLLHALAFKYMAQGRVTHDHVPDDPFIESERRQITFGCAVGIPTFFVRHDTHNQFLKYLLSNVRRVRQSRRYPGYLRVHHAEYRRALLDVIRRDAADLIEMFGMEETMADLERRISDPDHESAFGSLQSGIVQKAGGRSPMSLTADELNTAAEGYYRDDLRKEHFREAWDFFRNDLLSLEKNGARSGHDLRPVLEQVLRRRNNLSTTLLSSEEDVFAEQASPELLRDLICLLVLTLRADRTEAEKTLADTAPSICRTDEESETRVKQETCP